MKLEIDESYFKKEVRNDFTIDEMMKRCWAASIKVLSVIDDICKNNDIKYSAMYGTLLGAVRHYGFIPWDDDIDIVMLRADYNRFFSIAEKVLPEGYDVVSYKTIPNYWNLVSRVTNRIELSQETVDWRKKNFYGFPFVAGVDIFPLDFIPEEEKERDFFYNIMNILRITTECFRKENNIPMERGEYMLSQVEKLLNVRIERNDLILTQLAYLNDSVCATYGPEDSDIVSVAFDNLGKSIESRYLMPVSTYTDLIDMDFEMITIPVSRNYDGLLTTLFGKDYMTPVRYINHNYPYYKPDEKRFKEMGLI